MTYTRVKYRTTCESVDATERGKMTELMRRADASGLPLAAEVHCAIPREVYLIRPLLEGCDLQRLSKRSVNHMAADCAAIGRRLRSCGNALISPHRTNYVRPKLQVAH